MFYVYCEKYIFGHLMMGWKDRTSQFKRNSYQKYRPTQISMNQDFKNFDGGDAGSADFLKPIDPTEGNPRDKMLFEDEKVFAKQLIAKFFDDGEINITDSQRKIILAYMKHNGNGAEAARELGVSRERVRRAKNVVIRKIKQYFARNDDVREELFTIIK